MGLCYLLSKLLPANRRWNGSKTVSTCGAFLQVGFSTMSATSLAPMMCYKHPNGLRSVLKYPDIICGSDEHTAMLVIGWILLIVFVLGFVTLCTFAVYKESWLQWLGLVRMTLACDRYPKASCVYVCKFVLSYHSFHNAEKLEKQGRLTSDSFWMRKHLNFCMVLTFWPGPWRGPTLSTQE